MKSEFEHRTVVFCLLAAACALGGAGCAPEPPKPIVDAVAAPQQVELTPDDVVNVLRRAGFTNQEILEIGPQVRDAVAASGGVSITFNGKVQAILAAENGLLYITAAGRGTYMYRLDAHTFR
jgi:hypothetical protein